MRTMFIDRRDKVSAALVYEFLDRTGGRKRVDVLKDHVFTRINDSGLIVGLLAARPSVLLHGFRIAAGCASRGVATDLLNYALGAGRQLGYPEATFLIDKDNTPMIRFVQDAGATDEDADDTARVFSLEIL